MGLTYIPGRTVLHRSSIWGKMVMLGVLVAGLLLGYRSMLLSMGVIAAFTVISGRSRRFLSLLGYISPIIAATVVLYAITAIINKSTSVESLLFIGINTARLVASLSMVVVIVGTTNPREAEALLQRIGLSDFALALHLTIRMVPIIAGEIENIRTATRLRGSGSSSLRFLIPVMVNSIMRARELADALMFREQRFLRVPRPGKYDVLLALAAAIPLMAAI
ncbi:hypothetical protein GCM10007981_18460 [Thermocladium modestius]|uniref:Energy-coupling factor transporter transmembrane protein EcfT n=1 Tax=Thermocladium modestius TaxID=62609 RepID=A0A830GXM3_9CREN|nr:energy-coupling factor transporter transmembrane component T [Thermocladium modestius]GGP22430.1 hypothetical protein GCM10007981_18460 [Thermocladium modestius]